MKTALIFLVVAVLCLSCESLRYRRWPWRRVRSHCKLPKDPGFCRGYFRRFYYNIKTKQCESFIYGGCFGNRNRFQSLGMCRKACGAKKGSSRCKQPKVTGPCRAYFLRYYYNTVKGMCERFVYGGCLGNTNRFQSLRSCYKTCM